MTITQDHLIAELADLVGFHRDYMNSYGEQVFACSVAQKALLQAMGYDLTDSNSIKSHIQQLQQATWQNILPSTAIIGLEQAEPHIKVSLAHSDYQTLLWQITTENNQQLKGSYTLSDLDLVEQTTLTTTKQQKNVQHFAKYLLPLPKLEAGYHQLTLTYADKQQSCYLIYAPQTCYSTAQAAPYKMWGIAAQLYSLTSENNWGMGDFADLQQLVVNSAQQEVATIGLNPLHPLFQHNPAHRSPYSPTSRCFLNTLYINVEQIENFKTCIPAQAHYQSHNFQQRLALAKQAKHVDYCAVSALKFEIIELLYQDFIQNELASHSEQAQAFLAFKKSGGEGLAQLALFEALYEYFHQQNPQSYGWTTWPEAYQQADSVAVLTFAKNNQTRINYFIYCQWLAAKQLLKAKQLANENNMPIGLYLDLAVGCDGAGVDVWSAPELYVKGASIGAPPDATNALGQNWGLTPMNPVALQEKGYQPLIKALRSNMQYAGALRIDHILGLMRQYWVAPDMDATQGVYISFPLTDILRIIALESHRNQCVVIGEDLGTMPDGFSELMAKAGLLSYKILFFERESDGHFKAPEHYTAQALNTISTHDLPTLAGWWTGNDLAWRQKLNLYPNTQMAIADEQHRAKDRQLLIKALVEKQLLTPSEVLATQSAQLDRALSIAVQKFLALAPSHLQLIPLEDLLELVEQVNIPGTIDEHPNWLQKLPVKLEDLWQHQAVIEICKAMQQARPSREKQ